MVHNEVFRLVLNIVVLSLAFWWGLREGKGPDVARTKGGKDD